jgi:hypothetical protein
VTVDGVNLLPDSASLRTRAHALDAEADELTARATTLRAATRQVHWESPAAERYRGVSAALSSDIDSVVAGVRHAAGVLRAHADTVDRVVAVTAAAERAALHAARGIVSTGVDAATAPVRALAGLL